MQSSLPVGSIVVVRDPKLAAQLGREGVCGVVLQRRRGDARVLFPADRRTHWIANRRLWPSEVVPAGLRAIATLLRGLAPDEAQLERIDEQSLELHALCTQVDRATLEQLQQELDGALLDWRIVPFGMAQFTVIVELRG
jgi:hypothetical protein